MRTPARSVALASSNLAQVIPEQSPSSAFSFLLSLSLLCGLGAGGVDSGIRDEQRDPPGRVQLVWFAPLRAGPAVWLSHWLLIWYVWHGRVLGTLLQQR